MSVISPEDLDELYAALRFCRDIANEEWLNIVQFHPNHRAVIGAECALRHILRRCDEALPKEGAMEHPAITKLKADLAWRGPNGGTMGNVCLPRAMAESLVEHLDGLEKFEGVLEHIHAISKLYRQQLVSDAATDLAAGG
jgi:hypothetical protein